MDRWLDLLTTYTHNSELQGLTAPPLISTIHKSPQHPLSLCRACCVSTPAVPWQRPCNSGGSSASLDQALSSQTPAQNSLGCPNCLQDNYHVESRISNSASIVAHRFVATGTCLPSRCLETSLLYSPISRSSHSNGCTRCNINATYWSSWSSRARIHKLLSLQ
jgi:hypothetical protein